MRLEANPQLMFPKIAIKCVERGQQKHMYTPLRKVLQLLIEGTWHVQGSRSLVVIFFLRLHALAQARVEVVTDL